MPWKYNNRIVTEPPEGYIGMIYCITRKSDGKLYIGKKQFKHRVKGRVTKKEILATKTKKRVKITFKDSGWLAYQSSCVPLQEDIKLLGAKNFKFEILEFCKDKRDLSYKEVKWMFTLNVLECNSYNGNIAGRYFKQKPII